MPHIRNLSTTETLAWHTVESSIKDYDKSMMESHSKDIDSVLVMNGLFIGAVTGFVVPAYMLLQVDNTAQAVVILDRISSQLQSFRHTSPFLNNTMILAQTNSTLAQQFAPTTISRWVTVLWSISLIISLGSAMLGILAKQWIAEYLAWHEMIASPWHNIVIRQARFKAWEMWPTFIVISTIPALLELAITLFIASFVIFSWSLDRTLAISVSAVAAAYLAMISALISLPLFSKRCPYKSPTALACIIMVHTIWAWALAIPWFLSDPSKAPKRGKDLLVRIWHGYSSGYRWSLSSTRGAGAGLQRAWIFATEDVGDSSLKALSWRKRSKYPTLRSELTRTRLTQKVAQNIMKDELYTLHLGREAPKDSELASYPEFTCPSDIASEINEFSLLYDAFAWMVSSSLYSTHRDNIAICVGTLYQPNMSRYKVGPDISVPDSQPKEQASASLYQSLYIHSNKSLATWHIVASKQGSHREAKELELSEQQSQRKSATFMPHQTQIKEFSFTRMLREDLRNSGLYSPDVFDNGLTKDKPMHIKPRNEITIQVNMISQRFNGLDFKRRRLLGLFIASQVKAFIKDILHFVTEYYGDIIVPERPLRYLKTPSVTAGVLRPSESESQAKHSVHKSFALFSHQIAEMLCAIRYVALGQPSNDRMVRGLIELYPDLQVLLNTWEEIYNHPHRVDFDNSFPGLRSSLLDIVLSHINSTKIVSKHSKIELQAMQRVSISSFLSENSIVNLVRKYPLGSDSSQEDFHTYAWIVNKAIVEMSITSNKHHYFNVECLRRMTSALLYAQKKGWRNGGSYSLLKWIEAIMANDGNTVTLVGVYLHDTYEDEFRKFVHAVNTSKELIGKEQHEYITELGKVGEEE